MKRLLIFSLWIGLVACSPRLLPPQVSLPEAYLYGAEFSTDTLGVDSAWWRSFRDTTLNGYIAIALRENRDLAVALSRVEQARANLKVARAEYLPQVGIGIQAKGSFTDATRITQNYLIEPNLSWEIPLFGALRHAKRAAQAEMLASEWALKGVQLSLCAEVATTYFTLLEYQRDLHVARYSLELRNKSASLIDSLVRYGMTDGQSLEQARSLVYTAQADIANYERAVEQTYLALGVLLGQTPQRVDLSKQGEELYTSHRPTEIPIGLPSQLLTRRPDIQQAHYQVTKAAAEAGSARSARFPSIALTAEGGVISQTVKGLVTGMPWAWSAVGSISEPIFAFGKLKQNERIAIEAYNQAVKTYEQTLLSAFADVEQRLVAITTYREELARYVKLVEANARIAMTTLALYESGLTNYFDVIDSQRTLYESQMSYVNLLSQQQINYVELYKALGGGW